VLDDLFVSSLESKDMTTKRDAISTVKNILAGTSCPPFVLIICQDEIRRTRIISSITDKFSPKNSGNISPDAILRYDASDLSQDKFVTLKESLFSLSLFSSQRFFIIKNIEKLPASLVPEVASLVKELPSMSNIIFSAAELLASNVLYKLADKSNCLVKLEEMKGFDLKRWIQKELRNEGMANVEENVIDAIIQTGDSDLDKISRLINHLALFVEDKATSIQNIADISTHSPDPNEFALLDILNKKSLWRVETMLQEILQSGKSPFALLGLLAKNFSSYLRIAFLKQKGMSPAQIRERLGTSPWLFNKQLQTAEKYTAAQLLACLDAIFMADLKLKNRSIGAEAILGELVYRLAA